MKKTPEQILEDIKTSCELLGWRIAICDSDQAVNGLVIGDVEYIAQVIGQLENLEDYEIVAAPSDPNTDLH